MKNKKTLWIVVIVAAVVASLATLVTLMLRFKCKKRRALKSAADEGCACMRTSRRRKRRTDRFLPKTDVPPNENFVRGLIFLRKLLTEERRRAII